MPDLNQPPQTPRPIQPMPQPPDVAPLVPDNRRAVRETLRGYMPFAPIKQKVTQEKLKEPEILDGEGLDSLDEDIREYTLQSGDIVYGATDKGIGYKDLNEDRIGINPKANQIVVVDGMGGYGQGNLAAQLLAEAFEDYPDDPEKATKHASSLMMTESCDGGACYASAKITEKEGQKHLDISQAGDVKVLLIRNGKLISESKDQSRVQAYVDDELIDEDEALYHLKRNMVENAVMANSHKPKILDPIPVEKGDIVILMTDGISDNLTPDEIVKRIKGAKPKQIIQAISHLTDKRMEKAEEIAAISGAYADDPNDPEYKRYIELKRERVAKGIYSDGLKSAPKPDNRGIAVVQIS
jgi:protein phosphatase